MNESLFASKRRSYRLAVLVSAARQSSADLWGFVGLVLAVFALYALLRAPLLNSGLYLDPWIYTASFVNFDFLYSTFGSTYYLSRLPWLIPGIAAHAVMSPVPAFLLLHGAFFVGGALSAFLLVRRFLGRAPAYIAAAALMLCPLYYDAHSNDYPDGAIITYLLAAAYFAVGAAGSRRRIPRLVAAGFCLGAAVGINLTASVVGLGVMLAYATVAYVQPGILRRLATDAAAVAGGLLLLLVACGSFARAHGGEFLFFMAQWRFARSHSTTEWKAHGYGWLPHEPQLLIPLVLLAVLVPLLLTTRLRDWRRDEALRFAVASAGFLLFLTLLAYVSEFFFGGNWLELEYYFSIFMAPLVLALGSAVHLLAPQGAPVAGPRRIVAAVLVAAAPVWLVYGPKLSPRGLTASALALALAATAVVLVAVVAAAAERRSRARPIVAGIAVVSLLFAVNYAGAAGRMTHSVFVNGEAELASRRATLSMALQLIRFMRDNGLQTSAPAFWYDNRNRHELDAIQSTYLWMTSSIGFHMPRFGSPERSRLEQLRPQNLVLLCTSPACAGAPAVIERGGYRLGLKASGELAAGGRRYWVVAYRVAKFAQADPTARFYSASASPLAAGPSGPPSIRALFTAGLPAGWTSTGAVAGRGPVRVRTKPAQWVYSVSSPESTLAPGSYRAFLSGQVIAGGLDLGVLDLDANKWIVQSFYWYGQRGFPRRWMTASFRLDAPTRIQFVLSNWVPRDESSRWELREFRLVRDR